MSVINVATFNINTFWEKTPTPLKYILLIALIVGGSYFLISKRLDSTTMQQLEKMEQSIEVTYQLVDKFESFQRFQNEYNNQIIKDIRNIYMLVTELNININRKIDYLVSSSGTYNKDLIDKLELLNESFERLSKAYQPEKKEPLEIGVIKK